MSLLLRNPGMKLSARVAAAVALAAGLSTALSSSGMPASATATAGPVWSWGFNVVGQLGDGARTQRSVPVRVRGMQSDREWS